MGDGKLVEGSRDIADIVPPNKEVSIFYTVYSMFLPNITAD